MGVYRVCDCALFPHHKDITYQLADSYYKMLYCDIVETTIYLSAYCVIYTCAPSGWLYVFIGYPDAPHTHTHTQTTQQQPTMKAHL